MDTFTWAPDYNAQQSSEPKLIEAQFGDGYVVASPDGINNNMRKWSFAWNNVPEDMAVAIENFLKAKGGWQRFLFEIPTIPSESVTVVCKSWSKVFSGYRSYNFTASFEERL